MSYSTLYGITADLHGEQITDYRNSWLFSPAIWGFLAQKYNTQDVIGFHGRDGWKAINNIMNQGKNFIEQICWEVSNQQIFSIKDKNIVADCIDEFINVAKSNADYSVERFNTIAKDIRELDASQYKFFVLKNTSVDDTVENWFYKYCDDEIIEDSYIECSLLDSDHFENELIVIDQSIKHIVEFVSPDDFKKTYMQYE